MKRPWIVYCSKWNKEKKRPLEDSRFQKAVTSVVLFYAIQTVRNCEWSSNLRQRQRNKRPRGHRLRNAICEICSVTSNAKIFTEHACVLNSHQTEYIWPTTLPERIWNSHKTQGYMQLKKPEILCGKSEPKLLSYKYKHVWKSYSSYDLVGTQKEPRLFCDHGKFCQKGKLYSPP